MSHLGMKILYSVVNNRDDAWCERVFAPWVDFEKVMREMIDNAIELNMPSLLILDFSGISFMDSSGIGLVMGRYKLMKSIGGKIRVQNLSPGAYKVMCLAGIERLGEVKQKEVI